jgi:hypothetical protein
MHKKKIIKKGRSRDLTTVPRKTEIKKMERKSSTPPNKKFDCVQALIKDQALIE